MRHPSITVNMAEEELYVRIRHKGHFIWFNFKPNVISAIDKVKAQLNIAENVELVFMDKDGAIFHKRAVFKKHLINSHSSIFSDTASNTIKLDKSEMYSGISYDIHKATVDSTNTINSNGVTDQLNPNENYSKFEDILNCAVITFITKLYDTLTISRSCVQLVIDCVRTFISCGALQLICDLINYRKTLCNCSALPFELATKMLKYLERSLENFSSEYKRYNYFDKSKYMVKPIQYKMGTTNDVQRKDNKTSLIIKPLSCAYVPIIDNLKLFLQLPDVLEKIITYQVHLYADSTNLKNIIHGSLWQSQKNKFYSNYTLPLLIYFDDLQVGNPLGSHAPFTKIGAIYYSIPTVPPQYVSKLKNIFVAQIFHSADKEACGNEVTFKRLLQDLQYLEKYGIDVEGLHTIFGLSESFSSTNYCRFCTGGRNDMNTQNKEDENLLRRKNHYNTHVDQKLYGVKGRCIWNELHFFHVYENVNCDVTHDLLEGVHRYDMARIVKYLISNQYFTLETLNHRIRYNSYECNEKNVLPSVKQEHINNGDLIPAESEYWQFYSLLLDMTDILMSSEFCADDIKHLELLISQHNSLYNHLFSESLKPKHHFLVHYPRIIKLVGPLLPISCIRFEAKHRELKAVANSTRCRINIPITIVNRIQLKTCYRYISKAGLTDTIGMGVPIEIDDSKLKSTDYNELLKRYYNVDWYSKNGVIYNKNGVLNYGVEQSVPKFAKIIYIFINKDIPSSVVFYCNMYTTIEYSLHYKAYLVELSNVQTLISLSDVHGKYPTTEHILPRGIYVSLPKYIRLEEYESLV